MLTRARSSLYYAAPEGMWGGGLFDGWLEKKDTLLRDLAECFAVSSLLTGSNSALNIYFSQATGKRKMDTQETCFKRNFSLA